METNLKKGRKKMIAGVQIIGIFFGIIMMYLSYVYYKRRNYSWKSFLAWSTIWIMFVLIIMFPETIYGIMQILEIEKTSDFIVMSGFALYAIIIFYVYITTKQTQHKVEVLVRRIAHQRVEKKQEKKPKFKSNKKTVKKKKKIKIKK